jgi:hypothetical protein
MTKLFRLRIFSAVFMTWAVFTPALGGDRSQKATSRWYEFVPVLTLFVADSQTANNLLGILGLARPGPCVIGVEMGFMLEWMPG